MANIKHENNSHTFIYDLPYDKTRWARFFKEYKNCTQNQLQKYILKTENERKKWQNDISRWECVKICQHIFSHTFYDAEKQRYETPKILLQNKHFIVQEIQELSKICNRVLSAYLKQQGAELQEMKDFYEQRKAEIAISLKAHRKEHANEVIECPHCKAKVSRTGISKHKKSIKCLSNGQNIQETTPESFVR